MATPLSPDAITATEFQSTLSRYDTVLHSISKPSSDDKDSLEHLDTYRFSTVPSRLDHVRKEGGQLHLHKEEVESLIRWKLKHGKFRPRLVKLVSSNTVSEIETATRLAFALLAPESSSTKQIQSAVEKLTVLKGIGPASASLLLSVAFPDFVPFFSDEAFRWVMAGVDYAGNTGGKSWDRKIKYDKKEYSELIKKVSEVTKRLGGDVKAVDVEKVAWVLGREKAAMWAHNEETSPGEVNRERKGVKRKPVKVPEADGVRRSKRQRK